MPIDHDGVGEFVSQPLCRGVQKMNGFPDPASGHDSGMNYEEIERSKKRELEERLRKIEERLRKLERNHRLF